MNAIKKPIRLFLDMDGVFCDFEKGVQEVSGGKGSDEIDDDKLWPLLMKNPDFFAELDPMDGALELWKEVTSFLQRSGQKTPIFLTGCPSNSDFRKLAETGKEAWVRKHFLVKGGEISVLSVPPNAILEDAKGLQTMLEELLERAGINDCIMIFCRPKQKYFFSRDTPYTSVLLDDRVTAGKLWTEPGYFLWHESTPSRFQNKNHRNNTSRKAVKTSIAKLKSLKGGKRRTNSRTTQ